MIGPNRRAVLRALALGGVAVGGALGTAGCAVTFPDVRLRLATGGTQGVYYALGSALATVWQERLGLRTAPEVLSTAGSVDNLALLTSGLADIAFSQVDAAADVVGAAERGGRAAPVALGRVYDEFVHVVVPRDSPVQTVADLRGRRVSLGARESGVFVIARRVLELSGLAVTDVAAEYLGINDSVAAMAAGGLDGFFWTGGVPTDGVDGLSRRMPIRLLDLEQLLPAMRRAFPVYAPGTVPATSYGIPTSITTVLVRNFLLVDAGVPDDLAYALIAALFEAQEELVVINPLARSIDLRAAVGTQPVALHPGAKRYFGDVKDA